MPITRVVFLAGGTLRGMENGHARKFAEVLAGVKDVLAQVKGFLFASVKWRPMGKFLVDSSPVFPAAGADVPRYSAPGNPELAALIEKAASATGLWAETVQGRELAPGPWEPLTVLRPQADLAVVPLSLSQMSPEAHRKWGVAVRRGARDWPEPLALIVDGSLSARFDISAADTPALKQIIKFNDEVVRLLDSGKIGELDEMERDLFKAAQPEGGWGSLFCLWGALGEKIAGVKHHYGYPLPGVASAAFSFSLL